MRKFKKILVTVAKLLATINDLLTAIAARRMGFSKEDHEEYKRTRHQNPYYGMSIRELAKCANGVINEVNEILGECETCPVKQCVKEARETGNPITVEELVCRTNDEAFNPSPKHAVIPNAMMFIDAYRNPTSNHNNNSYYYDNYQDYNQYNHNYQYSSLPHYQQPQYPRGYDNSGYWSDSYGKSVGWNEYPPQQPNYGYEQPRMIDYRSRRIPDHILFSQQFGQQFNQQPYVDITGCFNAALEAEKNGMFKMPMFHSNMNQNNNNCSNQSYGNTQNNNMYGNTGYEDPYYGKEDIYCGEIRSPWRTESTIENMYDFEAMSYLTNDLNTAKMDHVDMSNPNAYGNV